jgi:hypothetical protein
MHEPKNEAQLGQLLQSKFKEFEQIFSTDAKPLGSSI